MTNARLFLLCHDWFTPRSSACCHCFDWERGPTARKIVMKKKAKKKSKGT